MRCQETARVVIAAVYLSTLCTVALYTSLSPEEGRAEPPTGIERSRALPSLQPPVLVKPLPPEELSKLNAIARKAIQKSPIQSKTVVGIHHALLDPSVVQQVLKSRPANSAPKVIIELPNNQSAVIVTDSLEPAKGNVMWKGTCGLIQIKRRHINFDPQKTVFARASAIEHQLVLADYPCIGHYNATNC